MRRAIAVVLLLLTAGCASPLGPPSIPDERLNETARYDWDASANATYNVTGTSYHATYRVTDDTLAVDRRDGLGSPKPVRMRAVAYRYPNGTYVNGSALDVTVTRTETVVALPADRGRFGYTADASPKRFATPVHVNGSHEVILPPNRAVGNPIVGRVRPPADETTRIDGRLHVRWAAPEDRIAVRYYLGRDITILGGLLALAGIVAAVAALRVWAQIRALRREREAEGLNVDPDDSGRDPPPGFE